MTFRQYSGSRATWITAEHILNWLMTLDVWWDLTKEDLVLLAPYPVTVISIDDDIDRLQLSCVDLHKINGTMLRTKITPKPGVVQHAIRRDLPMNIDSGLDTQPKVSDASYDSYDSDAGDFADEAMNFNDLVLDSDNEDIIWVPPPLDSTNDADTTRSRFTK
ncbi:hypothetical protein J4E91_001017 [Alternaria rosae]|nr:hypothetical protein J4E91_001017 [Alternaria rosae]